MSKTPEEVIARLQRRLENTGKHIIALVDSLAGARRDVKRLEDLLAWIHRKANEELREQREPGDLWDEISRTIEQAIPTTLKKKGQL